MLPNYTGILCTCIPENWRLSRTSFYHVFVGLPEAVQLLAATSAQVQDTPPSTDNPTGEQDDARAALWGNTEHRQEAGQAAETDEEAERRDGEGPGEADRVQTAREAAAWWQTETGTALHIIKLT